jgi:hypothetical protein
MHRIQIRIISTMKGALPPSSNDNFFRVWAHIVAST